MSNDGFQIEIPTFDTEPDSLFGGRDTVGFGGGFGGGGGGGFGGSSFGGNSSGFGFGSPAHSGALAQVEGFGGSRSGFHVRGDSAASDISGRSLQFGASSQQHLRPNTSTDNFGQSGSTTPNALVLNQSQGFTRNASKTSLAGAANSSVDVLSIASPPPNHFRFPTRKQSFASIKNVLRINKTSNQEPPPPMPSLDATYPALRNTSGRSVSSTAQHPSLNTRDIRRQPSGLPTSAKTSPQTSISTRPPYGFNRVRANSHAASGHSHSSSNAPSETDEFRVDISPDFGRVPRVPPVPPVPDEYGSNAPRHRAMPSSYSQTGDTTAQPQKPHEYAIHVLFTKFVNCAEALVELYLNQSLHAEPLLTEILGSGRDTTADFDALLDSLAQLARKHARPVIDSIMRWKKAHAKQKLDSTLVEQHLSQSQGRYRGTMDVSRELVRRKELATIYLMCRALLAVMRSMGKDGLDERYGDQLESTFFDEFVCDPDMKLLSHSANHRANAELYAMILGEMANFRFVSVTDRYIGALHPLATGQVVKDGGTRFENIIRGLEYIKLKVYPSEAFEEGAEFVENLSKSFANAHGQRLKTTYAEVLTKVLHPVGKTAMHEVNHPLWAKAIELMYPKANLMSKPQYWSVAYPLAVTLLCVAPHEYFQRNWIPCVEASTRKMKEKAHRQIALGGILRIIWTYLYRCQEPASTTMSKLDTLLKQFFPTKWRMASPYEEGNEELAAIVHLTLSRHPTHGREAALDLIQETALQNLALNAPLSVFLDTVPVDRVAIAIRAALLSFECAEKDAAPAWPHSVNFTALSSAADAEATKSGPLPETLLGKPGMQEFFDRFAPVVGKLIAICGSLVGGLLTVEPRYHIQSTLTYEEKEDLVIRHHGADLTVAYHEQYIPPIEMLRVCFDSLPRCLHPSTNLTEILDLLVRSILHLESELSTAAELALRRFAISEQHTPTVLARLTRFLFAPYNPVRDRSLPHGPASQQERLIALWADTVVSWSERLQKSGDPKEEPNKDIRVGINLPTLVQDIEAGALYLLTSIRRIIRIGGFRVLRAIPTLHQHLLPRKSANGGVPEQRRVINILEGLSTEDISLPGQNLPVTDMEYARLAEWKASSQVNVMSRMAESRGETDNRLWRFVLPCVVRKCLVEAPEVFQTCRDTISASVLRYRTLMSDLSQIQGKGSATSLARSPPPSRSAPVVSRPEHNDEVDQWKNWTVVLCASACDTNDSLSPIKEHSRAPSDSSSQRDQLTTPRDLFRHLIPFLVAEEQRFRSGVIQAMGCIHPSAYRRLLEDLHSITTHIHDDPKSQMTNKTKTDRPANKLHIAVMQVYRLTSHFAKDVKSIRDQSTLNLLLQFVRESKAYFSDSDTCMDVDALRLRRFFCGVVEMLFQGMSSLEDADRFLSSSIRLGLFKLCQQWCAYGLSPAQRRRYEEAINGSSHDAKSAGSREAASEPDKLSKAAAAAMISLCSPAFFAHEIPATSLADVRGVEVDEPLEISSTMDWMSALFQTAPEGIKQSARKALRTLLSRGMKQPALADEILRRGCFSVDAPSEGQEYFSVLADLLLEDQEHHLDFSQVTCFSLNNLCHPMTWRRQRAFSIVEKLVAENPELDSRRLAQAETTILCSDASTYLGGQRRISAVLADAYPNEAQAMLAECTLRLPQTKCKRVDMLEALAPWAAVCSLLTRDGYLSPNGFSSLNNLLALTVQYRPDHPEVITTLWQNITARPSPHHAIAVVKFLVEQAAQRGSPEFLDNARHIMAGLSRSDVGTMVYEELCAIIDSVGDISTGPTRAVTPEVSSTLYTASLINLSTSRLKTSLSTGQVALALITDMAIDRPWDFHDQLPTVLHAIFTHLDHSQPYLQNIIQNFLFRFLRSWLPGYDEIPESSGMPSRVTVKGKVQALEVRQDTLLWAGVEGEPRPASEIVRRMTALCAEVIDILEPLFPYLRQTWAEIAVRWVSQCSLPIVARRSSQLLRAIMPQMKHEMMASIVHRLSNIISDWSKQIQAFAKEILLTILAFVQSPNTDLSLLPTLFWSTSALLSTTVESEFVLAVEILGALLEKIDLADESTVHSLLIAKPNDWKGDDLVLQKLTVNGLRSSLTSSSSFALIRRLVKMPYDDAIDAKSDRLLSIYTIALPWCLNAMDTKPPDPEMVELAMDIAALADRDHREGISRIMVSFAKGRFRTKDDFLRQAVGSLREYFMAQYSTEVIMLLLGFVLNSERWMRLKSMQILKLLFGQAETRNPLILHGSELLMPLLRLLNTDLAQQALDVLDEPLAVTGGPAAAQVLRMSMHLPSPASEVSGEIFGLPLESGWCIAKPEEVRDTCRYNLLAVYTSFQHDLPPGPVSMIMFEEDGEYDGQYGTEVRVPAQDNISDGASVANLVNQLHDLGEFFQTDQGQSSNVEERVALILNRSLGRNAGDSSTMIQSDRDDSFSSQEWQEELAVTIPGTPGPFSQLFSSPQSAMDSLQRNFEADSDDDNDSTSYGDTFVPVHHQSSYQSSDDEDSNAFALEDTQSTFPKRRKSLRNIIGSRLGSRNGKAERRRMI
ncbi:Cell morphogenesis protein PAG1 [Tulasnella sp. JGI-2019a]|nr:Cell morphogenesis protein PAG1 [Tulasnella sp. JGI-2019a]